MLAVLLAGVNTRADPGTDKDKKRLNIIEIKTEIEDKFKTNTGYLPNRVLMLINNNSTFLHESNIRVYKNENSMMLSKPDRDELIVERNRLKAKLATINKDCYCNIDPNAPARAVVSDYTKKLMESQRVAANDLARLERILAEDV